MIWYEIFYFSPYLLLAIMIYLVIRRNGKGVKGKCCKCGTTKNLVDYCGIIYCERCLDRTKKGWI